MPAEWERALDRWQAADLIDAAAAGRIREFEQSQSGGAGFRWPVIVALAFGGLMLGAGVLLFVAAHWDELSPAMRFALVLAMTGVFHAGGAFAARHNENFALTLHGLGTASLGAGIFLAGQIFNMAAHWPSGVMLWAIGAWTGWALRRDWLQFTMAAALTPFWLAGEWVELFPRADGDAFRVLAEGLLLISITYLSARTRDRATPSRKALVWMGAITILPCTIALAAEYEMWRTTTEAHSGSLIAVGYLLAYGLPLALAYFLRGKDVWANFVAAAWVALLGVIGRTHNVGVYAWCAVGAAGMVAWGVREGRSERINIGMIGFALTLMFFYFSEVMDKLDRSASLIGFGLLFLAGGWALEKMRRRLVAHARAAQ
jgi:uncharacterized membrane protein